MTPKSAAVLVASLCLLGAFVGASSGLERAMEAKAAQPQPFGMRVIAIPASVKGDEITSANLSGSGLVALGTAGGHLSIVDRNLQPWRGGWERSTDSSAISRIAFSPDEAAIAGVTSEAVLVWRLDQETVVKIPIKASNSAIALSPGGRWLAVAGFDVSVFDVPDQRLVRKFEQEMGSGGAGVYEALAFTPDAAVVVAAALPGKIDGWNIASGKQVWRWRCSACGADGVAFSRDAALAMLGTADAHVLLWDTTSGTVLKDKKMSVVYGDHVYGTAASLKGALVTAGTASGSVLVWDTASNVIIARAQPSGQPITGIASSDDGQVMLVEGQKAWHVGPGVFDVPMGHDRWLMTLIRR